MLPGTESKLLSNLTRLRRMIITSEMRQMVLVAVWYDDDAYDEYGERDLTRAASSCSFHRDPSKG